MSAIVSRFIAACQAKELHKKAEAARHSAEQCRDFTKRLIELRRVRDLEKLADAAERRW